MAAKGSSNSTTVILILLFLITFPFWIGVIAAVGGILAGVFGAFFGIIGGLFGAVTEVITWPFKMLYGCHWGFGPHIHFNGVVIVAIIILAVTLSRRTPK